MKYVIFKRIDNNFSDILTDVAIKKHIKTKIFWVGCLMLGFNELSDELFGYVCIKYGDDIFDPLNGKDYSPVPFVDYTPKNPNIK